MKLCTVAISSPLGEIRRFGVLQDHHFIDFNKIWEWHYTKNNFFNAIERANYKLPASLSACLRLHEEPLNIFQETLELYKKCEKSGDEFLNFIKHPLDEIAFKCPIDQIPTYRDFYAHEGHVKKGFEKRGEDVPAAWYEIPAYYKGATAGFIGHEEVVPWPSYTKKLDYELELGLVMAKDGYNIKEKAATQFMLGFTILNDISARDIQKKEMSIRLGPAKGKDFCSVLGPVITTMDEFSFKEPSLKMTAKVNGKEWSSGLSSDAHFSFSQMVAHASRDEWIKAGDLLGSGTITTGCGLELDQWIQPGDEVELEVEGIGKLKNKISITKEP